MKKDKNGNIISDITNMKKKLLILQNSLTHQVYLYHRKSQDTKEDNPHTTGTLIVKEIKAAITSLKANTVLDADEISAKLLKARKRNIIEIIHRLI